MASRWARMRQLSPLIETTVAWCRRRSRIAIAGVVSWKIWPQSAMCRLVVRMIEPCS